MNGHELGTNDSDDNSGNVSCNFSYAIDSSSVYNSNDRDDGNEENANNKESNNVKFRV